MQALILAGGLGTRLRELVNDRPKPMAEIAADKPFLEYQIEYLRNYGITEIVLCVGYLWEKIQEYFGDGEKLGVKIFYAVEKELLGTGGAIKNAEKYIDSPFMVLNGDSFFDADIDAMADFHFAKRKSFENYVGTMALTEVENRSAYGSIIRDENEIVTTFKEKSPELNSPGLINAGVYLLEPKILEMIPAGRKVSLEKEIYPKLLEKRLRLGGFASNVFFVDIGTPEGFHRFQEYIKEEVV